MDEPPNVVEEEPSPLVPRPPVTVGGSEVKGGERPGIVVFVPLLKTRIDLTSKYASSKFDGGPKTQSSLQLPEQVCENIESMPALVKHKHITYKHANFTKQGSITD